MCNCFKQGTFRQNYYDTTMEALKVLVFDNSSLPKLVLCAKCLEFMIYLVRKIGPDNFEEQEAVQVSISPNSELTQIIYDVLLKPKLKLR
jgi:hypothetical protein